MEKQNKMKNYLSEVNSDSGSRKLLGELGNDSETILSILKSILLDFFYFCGLSLLIVTSSRPRVKRFTLHGSVRFYSYL